jgi:hypothetical protein
MHATDIVGYTFDAENYTPQGIIARLTTNPGQVGPVVVARENVEKNLDVLAHIAGIDRHDESSYDSSEFPKVIFASDLTDGELAVDADGSYVEL